MWVKYLNAWRPTQVASESLMGGQTAFSSKDGRNSYGKAFEEKKWQKKKEKLHLHMQ